MTIFTIIPSLHATREELCASIAYFPLVGLVLGVLLSALMWALSPVLEPEPLAALLVVALAFMTRALHLDGLCDTADAIGSRAPRERALEIMKDSAAGSLGVVAVVSVLLLKTGAAVTLCRSNAWQLFILIPCLSRWSLNALSSLSTYARKQEGLGSAFCMPHGQSATVIAALSSIAASWFLFQLKGLFLFAGATGLSVVSASYFKSRFGGVTGDCLGAHLETVETLLFLTGAALFAWTG